MMQLRGLGIQKPRFEAPFLLDSLLKVESPEGKIYELLVFRAHTKGL